jgi:hypothetical protein
VSYAAVYDKIQALYGSWLPAQTQQGRIAFASGTPSAPGDYGQIAQTIAVTPGQSDYTMGFWLKDDFTATTVGYHFKQLLVNGVVAWDEDVAYDEAELDQGFVSGNPPCLCRPHPTVTGSEQRHYCPARLRQARRHELRRERVLRSDRNDRVHAGERQFRWHDWLGVHQS